VQDDSNEKESIFDEDLLQKCLSPGGKWEEDQVYRSSQK
jgi:hypothetical protein